MGERLEEALAAHRHEVEQALEEAEEELSALNVRRRELEDLIDQARATLGLPESPVAKRPTLHEAIERVLEEIRNQWMEAKDIAHHVNRQSLYRRGDGAPIDTSQIHARTNHYQHLFEKQGSRIRMRVVEEAEG
jgi:chromosome segregation ATPase